MCGQYWIDPETDDPGLKKLLSGGMSAGFVRPSEPATALVAGDGARARAEVLRWGLPRAGGGRVINARGETAARLPLFRDAFLNRRCALPASGFFEWTPGPPKQKVLFARPDGRALYLAGLYTPAREFAVLTAAANASVAPVHPRMPVVLALDEIVPFLADPDTAAYFLRRAQPALARRDV